MIGKLIESAIENGVTSISLCVSNFEDGSRLVEWIEDGKRVGITKEVDPSESGWYFVSRVHPDLCVCGHVDKFDADHLVELMSSD